MMKVCSSYLNVRASSGLRCHDPEQQKPSQLNGLVAQVKLVSLKPELKNTISVRQMSTKCVHTKSITVHRFSFLATTDKHSVANKKKRSTMT